MAKTIEPPILISRILAFVLSASIVVLGVLVFVLFKMIPLERPEVFFLLTPTRSTNVVIKPLTPDSDNKTATDNYIRGFIREYIIARNTINPNITVLKNNWSKIVKPWSSNSVFSDFVKTNLYKEYTLGTQAPTMSCSVNFSNSAKDSAIIRIEESTYNVNFTWICENIGGQTTQKNYKIQIRIQSDFDEKTSGMFDNLSRLSVHPLGIQIVQYKVLYGKEDPLNSDIER
mgnify:CR=1 FL=1